MRLFIVAGVLWSALALTLFASEPKGPHSGAIQSAALLQVGEKVADSPDEAEKMIALPPDATGAFQTATEDGTRYLLLRIPGLREKATRIHFEKFNVQGGGRVYVYSATTDGTVSPVYGPYKGTGPLQSGEFWTPAIAGEQVIVEFQTDGEMPADLPFLITEIARAQSAVPEAQPEPAEATGDIRTSLYRGVPVTHTVRDGLAVFQGDIILGQANELPAAARTSKGNRRGALALTGASYRWTNSTIPYVIDPTMPNPTLITNAIAHWNLKMAGYVQMVPRTNEANYLNFMRMTGNVCSSYVGMLGGAQNVYIGPYCSTGNIIHEIGHAWGLWHEHMREDRDKYVQIKWENISPGAEYNFDQHITDGDDMGAYDFGSIMHYSDNSFSANGQPTIVTIPAGIAIGQRSGLSTGDVAAIRALYPAPAPAAGSFVTVTVSSIVWGMPIQVDGVTYGGGTQFSWKPGSVHTLTAQNPADANGVRYTFTTWEDGSSTSRTITVPTKTATYKANYATSYSLVATALSPGTASVNPASADTFYTPGTVVGITATAPAGYCFASWSGLIAGTPAATSVAVTKAYTVRASFKAGSVTLNSTTLAASELANVYTVGVNATTGCLWTAVSNNPWITVTAGGSGTAAGTVTLSVAENTTGQPRQGTVTIGQQVLTVSQAAPPPPAPAAMQMMKTETPVIVTVTDSGNSRTTSLQISPGAAKPDGAYPTSSYSQVRSISGSQVNIVAYLNTASTTAVTVAVQSSRPDLIQVPDSVQVPAGTNRLTIPALFGTAVANEAITLSITASGVTLPVSITLAPPTVTYHATGAATIKGGAGMTNNLVIISASAVAGSTVSLVSSNPSVLSVPASVSIPAGTNRTTYPISTTPVSAPEVVTIRATSGGVTQTATITVNP